MQPIVTLAPSPHIGFLADPTRRGWCHAIGHLRTRQAVPLVRVVQVPHVNFPLGPFPSEQALQLVVGRPSSCCPSLFHNLCRNRFHHFLLCVIFHPFLLCVIPIKQTRSKHFAGDMTDINLLRSNLPRPGGPGPVLLVAPVARNHLTRTDHQACLKQTSAEESNQAKASGKAHCWVLRTSQAKFGIMDWLKAACRKANGGYNAFYSMSGSLSATFLGM